jgi:hypothetical protein
MTDSTSYEAPAIVERTPIELPLVGILTSTVPSAVFRTTPVYEAPAIVERTQLHQPLVLSISGTN